MSETTFYHSASRLMTTNGFPESADIHGAHVIMCFSGRLFSLPIGSRSLPPPPLRYYLSSRLGKIKRRRSHPTASSQQTQTRHPNTADLAGNQSQIICLYLHQCLPALSVMHEKLLLLLLSLLQTILGFVTSATNLHICNGNKQALIHEQQWRIKSGRGGSTLPPPGNV